jgi:hypothetical protein
MPLTEKGGLIRSKMRAHYGKKKGDRVFYASENKGTIPGVHPTGKSPRRSHRPKAGTSNPMQRHGAKGSEHPRVRNPST